MLKILVIDDEEPIRRALGRTLKSDGYQEGGPWEGR
jgi:CheY-like chemotaxis protein